MKDSDQGFDWRCTCDCRGKGEQITSVSRKLQTYSEQN